MKVVLKKELSVEEAATMRVGAIVRGMPSLLIEDLTIEKIGFKLIVFNKETLTSWKDIEVKTREEAIEYIIADGLEVHAFNTWPELLQWAASIKPEEGSGCCSPGHYFPTNCCT